MDIGVSELLLEKRNDFLEVMQLEAVNLLLLRRVDQNDARIRLRHSRKRRRGDRGSYDCRLKPSAQAEQRCLTAQGRVGQE